MELPLLLKISCYIYNKVFNEKCWPEKTNQHERPTRLLSNNLLNK